MLRKFKRLLILLFIGIVLLTSGFGAVFRTSEVRAYTDEEIRIKAQELGMMDVKDAIGE